MKTNQLNQIIEAAEKILLTQKVKKSDMNVAISEVQSLFVESGVNLTIAQTEAFSDEYASKRAKGDK